jgi:hypothetical protein
MRIVERWRAWRELRSLAPLTASSAEGSHVKFSGVVRVLDETVFAPLSGRESVIARSGIRGTSSGPLPMLQIRPFVVEATTSAVVVDGSDVILGVRAEKLRTASSERRLAFLARFGFKPQGNIWFEEVVVAPGDRITVGGVLMHDLNPQPPTNERAFREGVVPTLRIVGSNEHPLVIASTR